MIKAIIFDLDGVIVSTDSFHYKAWKNIADREEIIFNEEINNRLRGVSRRESLNIILENALKNYTEEEKFILMEEKNNLYKGFLNALDKDAVLPGINDLLKYLEDNDYLFGVASSSKNAKKILKQIDLFNRFKVIVDGYATEKSKPAPDIFLIAASRLGVKPNECIVLEDALAGIEAAKTAQMKAVAIYDAAKYNKADYTISNPKDLIFILNSYNTRQP